ncbi:serine protease inhibitor 77Ba [Phlebotomus papatasi]|uniref:serine protease inhibitor 77Ba n=1 Tax=Phlebotomus papatasi TaxID=29031 RepID=UPI00248456AF|nr:serine protease inhibitor 77Ba [Phlebotomus papatasi]
MDKFLYISFFLVILVELSKSQGTAGNPTASNVQVQQVQGAEIPTISQTNSQQNVQTQQVQQQNYQELQEFLLQQEYLEKQKQQQLLLQQQQQQQQLLQQQQQQQILQQQKPPQQQITVTQRLPSLQEIQHDTSQTNLLTNTSNLEREVLRLISDGSEHFALQLFKGVIEENSAQNYNFIMSPFSIWSLIVLLVEGSGGRTLSEIESVLGLPKNIAYVRDGYRQIRNALNVNTSTLEISTLHAMFSDKNRPVHPDFERRIEQFYYTEVIPVNYLETLQTAQTINRYVATATGGKINQILKRGDLMDANMILISAIFFRGQWRSPFNVSQTTEEPFYDEFGKTQGKVNMMFQRGSFPYTAIADLDAHILELPYGNLNRLSMIILLPRKGTPLGQVIEKLANVRLQRVYDELKKAADEYEDDEVEVYMPRFKITADFVLNRVLEKMGLLDIFSPTNANLSKITSSQIYLSRLIHKATIEVNEEGTVASAVTAGVFANKATPPRFYANRPFAYLIVDKTTNILLFCGQVKNPNTFYF